MLRNKPRDKETQSQTWALDEANITVVARRGGVMDWVGGAGVGGQGGRQVGGQRILGRRFLVTSHTHARLPSCAGGGQACVPE